MTALPLKRQAVTRAAHLTSIDAPSSVYQNGSYLEYNPSWHIEESPFKVKQILRMLDCVPLAPKSVCDVGCGAGAVLAKLQPHLPAECACYGYDISPEAISMCHGKENIRLHYSLGDVRTQDQNPVFDLLLLLDVFEHVEDYMGLLRDLRSRANYKLFHIPLDLSVQAVARRNGLLRRRDDHAHLHYFSKETALRTLTDVGYELVHYFYTPRCIELGDRFVQKLARTPRRWCFAAAPDLTVRFLGGYSLMVLAQ